MTIGGGSPLETKPAGIETEAGGDGGSVTANKGRPSFLAGAESAGAGTGGVTRRDPGCGAKLVADASVALVVEGLLANGMTNFASQSGQMPRLPAKCSLTLSRCPLGQTNRIPIGWPWIRAVVDSELNYRWNNPKKAIARGGGRHARPAFDHCRPVVGDLAKVGLHREKNGPFRPTGIWRVFGRYHRIKFKQGLWPPQIGYIGWSDGGMIDTAERGATVLWGVLAISVFEGKRVPRWLPGAISP